METLRIRFDQPSTAAWIASSISEAPVLGRDVGIGRASNVAAAFWRSNTDNHRVLLIVEDRFFSSLAVQTAAWNVRRYLLSHSDFQPGDLVVLRMKNSAEYLAAFYGVLLADGVVVPIAPQIEDDRWRLIRRSCRPPVVITRTRDTETMGPSLRFVDLDLLAEPLPPDVDIDVQRGDHDLAMVLYTSGSTGAPKGVMLSHRNLLANSQSILEYLPIDRDDRALAVLPWYHAFGNSILLTHSLIGATLVLAGSATFPVTVVQALKTHRATSLSAVPELFSMLMRFDSLDNVRLPDLRYMSVAGGALTPDLACRLADRIAPAPFYVMYGQTEATARLAYLPPEELPRRSGSIGRAIPGVRLRVVDDADGEVSPGQIGRLVARGENVMLGYWKDGTRSAPWSQGGWLDTGDLATVDEDGYFYLRGRRSLLVKIQGHRVHPLEIEEFVRGHFSGIQAAVIPYESGGSTRLALFIVAGAKLTVDDQEIRRVCRDALPPYKIPSRIHRLDHWPLNGAGKIDRTALARWLHSQERRAS
ncbi:MAG: AMP-dependent synthetase [Planctomycetaceae bacterium]|nr:MAG: AMP-dependent synthetase [Planctomycetaceae bacterium]